MVKFGDLMTRSSKDIFKNSTSHLLIFIMTSQIWQKEQISCEKNRTFPQNKKKCPSDDAF